ncbi:HET-domain-containing protein [Pyrenochaeta sp. DS3sAY3a]|nr:HET-domain-containing protein [Pyrenochaeta sp. DS3sAY3a]
MKSRVFLSCIPYLFYDLVNHEEVEPSTESMSTWSLTKNWLEVCDNSHQSCAKSRLESRYSPTRVIDITPGQPPRLIAVGASTKPFRYTTLSHCWGSSLHLSLLSTNIDTLQMAIPSSGLSKTFQDAIEVTRRLQINYLWIDSLCIMQDSKQDWMEQSAKMALVYSNAYCNIAAAHATDGSYGCFTNRNPTFVRPIEVALDWGPQPGSYYAVQSSYEQDTMLRSPLNMRAWVFQERSVARRNLYFCDTEVLFQCHHMVASERFPKGLPPRVGMTLGGIQVRLNGPKIRQSKGLQPDMALDAYSYWGLLVQSFSLGKLTYATDKLVAFSAIASEMQQHLRSPYLAGLWRAYLPYQLLWEVRGVQWTANSSRPREYIAPSWSWASVTGRVEKACEVRFADDREILLNVLDAHVALVSDLNPYGQVKGGYLRVQVFIAKGSLFSIPTSSTGRMFIRLQTGKDIHAIVILDNSEDRGERDGEELHFVPIQYLPHYEEVNFNGVSMALPLVSGLILRQTCPFKEEYVRIGKFEIYQNPRDFQSACGLMGAQMGHGLRHDAGGWGEARIITIL